MTLLILGILLWWAAHLFKRVAPAQRTALTERMGDASKGVIAAVLLAAVVLMVIGFRTGDFYAIFDPPAWGRHLNNVLMLIAVALFGLGNSQSRLRGSMRHPMLTGMLLWAVAHLLANGDSLSLVLFGSMAVWSVVEMLVINRAEPVWTPYKGGTAAGDLRFAIISVAVFAVIAAVHTWLGYWPFP